MRLSTRFALCVAVLVPVLVLLAGFVVFRVAAHDMRAERDRQLAVRLRALTPMAAVYVRRARPRSKVSPDFAAQRLTAAALGADGPGGLYVGVPGADPLVIGNVPSVLPDPATERAGTGRRGTEAPVPHDPVTYGPGTFSAGEGRWRYIAADLGPKGVRARLWVLEPEQRLAGQLALLRRRLALITLIAVGVGAAAGFGLGRLAVRPLAVLRRQARIIDVPSRGGGRLATGSGVADVDELARLLNELLDRRDAAVVRTEEALGSARAFAATAAHELRTPLTSMGTNLSLLDHPGLEPAERAEIAADLRAEHRRIQRLITMLRQLARGELLDPALFCDDVDLVEIAATAVEEARHRHPHATTTSRLDADVRVRGWPEGLRLIVDNLIDNAAVHGVGHDGRAVITVSLDQEGDEAVLAVQDTGPGISPAQRESVFTRFERRAGSPGSGLGLTLVRQQAELQGGSVSVAEGPGARVEVRLPVSGLRPYSRAAVRSWIAGKRD